MNAATHYAVQRVGYTAGSLPADYDLRVSRAARWLALVGRPRPLWQIILIALLRSLLVVTGLLVVPSMFQVTEAGPLSTVISAPSAAPGGRIAWSRKVSNGGDAIFIMNADGSDPRQLTHPRGATPCHPECRPSPSMHPEWDGYPAWSPDGKRLAFTNGTLNLINTDGSSMQRVPLTDFQSSQLSWDPDGRGLTIVAAAVPAAATPSLNPDRAMPVASTPAITRLDLASNTVAALVFGINTRHPSFTWSPDGTRLAYRANYDHQIHVMYIDGRRSYSLTVLDQAVEDLSWSPDGRQLAFMSYKYVGVSKIYLVNVDGTALHPLILQSPFSAEAEPAWSPDGQQLVFAAEKEQKWDLYRINRDGSGLTALTRDGQQNREPAWWGPR